MLIGIYIYISNVYGLDTHLIIIYTFLNVSLPLKQYWIFSTVAVGFGELCGHCHHLRDIFTDSVAWCGVPFHVWKPGGVCTVARVHTTTPCSAGAPAGLWLPCGLSRGWRTRHHTALVALRLSWQPQVLCTDTNNTLCFLIALLVA